MALAGLAEAGHGTRGEVEREQLRGLVAAAAALKDHVAALARFVARAPHRVREVGQRLGLGARSSDAEDLRRAAARLAVRDQHLAPGRVPVDEGVAAEVGVA